jgi:hypothetical protein
MFWAVATVFAICNGVSAWSASFKEMAPGERPRLLEQDWVALASAIGGLGWLAIPVMFGWKYGVAGAIVSLPVYILVGVLSRFAINGAIPEAAAIGQRNYRNEDSTIPPVRPRQVAVAVERTEPRPVARTRSSEFSYERKVAVLRGRIADHQITIEEPAVEIIGAADADQWHSEFTAGDIQRLESWQTWWVELEHASEEARFTLHVKNTTGLSLSALIFELWETQCSDASGRGRLFALSLSRPLPSFGERALRFSASIPLDHGVRRARVCGKIVGAR